LLQYFEIFGGANAQNSSPLVARLLRIKQGTVWQHSPVSELLE